MSDGMCQVVCFVPMVMQCHIYAMVVGPWSNSYPRAGEVGTDLVETLA